MSVDALLITLQVAVPMRMAELARMTPYQRHQAMEVWRSDAVEAVACEGDILQYRGGRRGETARVFNNLVRGLAVLAHVPGGVLFAGVHWCLEHQWGKHVSSITELTCNVGEAPFDARARPVVTVAAREAPFDARARPVVTVAAREVL